MDVPHLFEEFCRGNAEEAKMAGDGREGGREGGRQRGRDGQNAGTEGTDIIRIGQGRAGVYEMHAHAQPQILAALVVVSASSIGFLGCA
eukprot:751895-Hanusia_phi.AAC.1